MKHTRLTVLLLSALLCLGLLTSCGGSGLTDEEILTFISCHKKIRENLMAILLEGGMENEMV